MRTASEKLAKLKEEPATIEAARQLALAEIKQMTEAKQPVPY